jgi:hypothetical protein
MLDAARSRIREIGGAPNEAAARVLFEILAEEDGQSNLNETDANVFGTLVGEYYADAPTGDILNDTDITENEEEQSFSGAGGQ